MKAWQDVGASRDAARRARRGLAARVAAVIAATGIAIAAPSPTAAETCRGEGPGLHAFEADDEESGTGGTGAAPAPRPLRLLPDDDEESGVGGTGARPTRVAGGDDDESGLGGTGLLGPIRVLDEGRRGTPRRADEDLGGTRIWLNGLEIEIPDALALETTGDAQGANTLASGRMAWVEAQSVDGRLVATRVLLAEDRIGWTEMASRGVPAKRRGPPGRLREATRPTRLPGNMLRNVGRWTLRVSDVRVDVTAETLVHRDVVGHAAPKFRAGTWVRYQGFAVNEKRFLATRIELAPKGRIIVPETRLDQHVARALRADPAARPDYVSIEGFVRGTAEGPEVAGLAIALPERAGAEAREAMRPGRRIRVGGVVGADGALRVRPPPRTLRPARPGPPDATSAPRGEPAPSAREAGTPKPVDRPTARPGRPADVLVVPSRDLPRRPRVGRPAVDRAQ